MNNIRSVLSEEQEFSAGESQSRSYRFVHRTVCMADETLTPEEIATLQALLKENRKVGAKKGDDGEA